VPEESRITAVSEQLECDFSMIGLLVACITSGRCVRGCSARVLGGGFGGRFGRNFTCEAICGAPFGRLVRRQSINLCKLRCFRDSEQIWCLFHRCEVTGIQTRPRQTRTSYKSRLVRQDERRDSQQSTERNPPLKGKSRVRTNVFQNNQGIYSHVRFSSVTEDEYSKLVDRQYSRVLP
jgi:hypothetical protein